jgi:hypothetical protein
MANGKLLPFPDEDLRGGPLADGSTEPEQVIHWRPTLAKSMEIYNSRCYVRRLILVLTAKVRSLNVRPAAYSAAVRNAFGI